MEPQPLAIGVIAASVKQLGELTRLVRGAGYPVAVAVQLRDGERTRLPHTDAWIVNLDPHDDAAQALFEQLESGGAPVIYEDDLQLTVAAPSADKPELPALVRQQKERRLAAKLRQLVREPPATASSVTVRRAQKLWVIAASTGGPEAVAEFLQGIPGDLEGIALLYVQHIENHGHSNLCRVVAKHSCWSVQTIDAAVVIREKTIYMVSPEQQFELSDGGVISPLAEPWGGRYRPCIDQVIAKVARVYRNRSGAIIFTGMGDDGANSCTLMHHRGGQVWVQHFATCAIDSMPVSVTKKGCVSFSGKPRALAQQFVYFHRHGCISPGAAI